MLFINSLILVSDVKHLNGGDNSIDEHVFSLSISLSCQFIQV